jgi:hypothetical protein
LHAYYTCAYCQPQNEVILGKKHLSEHLKRVHKLKINLKTYFEDEKRIFGALKKWNGIGPKLQCNHCGFVTENVTIWTKHDCNVVKIEKPDFATRCSSDQTSVGSRTSSIDQDDEGSNQSISSNDECFFRNESTNCDSINDEASRSDLESCSDFNGGRNSAMAESESGDAPLPETCLFESHVPSVPDFSAVNEFFEFRLYDVGSAFHMNRIWDEALNSVHRKSTGVSFNKFDLVLARPVHDELALWEM